MARILNETERGIVTAALQNYSERLNTAEATGIEEVDRLVRQRADMASDLSRLSAASSRMSITSDDQ